MLTRHADVDVARVHQALDAVRDPELGRPLCELGMLGDVRVRRGRVRVEVRLTTASCPHTDELRSAVTTAVSGLDGVRGVEVSFAAMPARERAELGERLRADTPSLGGGGLGGGPAIYAVASGKGGVGKSTVTANLAAALAASGQRVGVLDADVWGYSIPRLFGVRRGPVVLGQRMLPVPAHGVALMSVGFFVSEDDPVVWRGPMLHKALSQFVTDTHWGTLDALFVDLPPGTGDATLSLLELLPDAALLVVTTPQLAARAVASRVVRMVSGQVAGVVENMSAAVCGCCGEANAVFGSGGGALLAEEAGVPLLGQVPLDVELREAGDRGRPVVLGSPAAASARELSRIATGLPAPRRKLAGRPLPLSVVGR
ncbi:Mrp/NBP35 family ATP-binding protein [Pseudonocardia acaciae]|uniref:Mrp/NBP35 family ATP-binding protein n=1 Tax=Pseudonocardia acaciae TaxID=551276 RepID=UPI0004909B15|nr:Mrp/NBP35 family ATP-binding protein [Pseudonocardia acaciae]